MNRATFLTGVLGGGLALVALAPSTGTALGDLAQARAARAEAAARASAPLPPDTPLILPAARIVPERAVGDLRGLAARGGVLVEAARADRQTNGLVRLTLRMSGPEKAVIALIDRIERERPTIRLVSWRAEALPDGGLRIEGQGVAAWR